MKAKLVYLLFLIAAVFIGLEIVLRIYNPFPARLRMDKIVLPRDQHIVINNNYVPVLDSVIYINKNSLGFRGPEKPSDTTNMVSLITVGGSTTECDVISDSTTWPFLLGESLSKVIPALWVNNAGMDGHSTFGHQILLNDYLLKLHPNFILFLVGVNDVERYDLNNFDKRFISKGIKGILEKSEIVVLLVNIRRSWMARKLKIQHNYKPFSEITEDNITFSQRYTDSVLNLQTPYLSAYRERLNALMDSCLNHGITPLLVTQPSLFGGGIDSLSGADLSLMNLHDGTNGELYWQRLERYNDITRDVAKQKGIYLADLARELPKNTLYFYDAVHFTVKGCGKVAEILTGELMKDSVFQRFIPADTVRQGD
ncbi:MAG: SGNH/GDSL hydrolase family protein [Bacteroidales bacterium]|nr:SGNH/GDSL hydrolase family protein [Bacteroidales bacterium]